MAGGKCLAVFVIATPGTDTVVALVLTAPVPACVGMVVVLRLGSGGAESRAAKLDTKSVVAGGTLLVELAPAVLDGCTLVLAPVLAVLVKLAELGVVVLVVVLSAGADVVGVGGDKLVEPDIVSA